MELRHLRYFVAVAEELHFGRAAVRLHMAQPPLSQQIKRLEAELGAQLFRRNRRRVELTDAGRLLLEQARPLLRDAERIETTMRRAGQGAAGRLRVGFVGSATYEILPLILRAFRDRYPDVELGLQEQPIAELLQGVAASRLDVALVRPPLRPVEGLELTPLVTERLVAVLPDSHPLAARDAIDVAELAGEPFVFLPRSIGSSLYEDVLAVCRQAGFGPDVVQEAAETQTIVSLVSAGIGISLLPAAVEAFQRPHVVYRPLLGPTPELELRLAARRGDPSPLVANFLAVARSVALRGEGGSALPPSGVS